MTAKVSLELSHLIIMNNLIYSYIPDTVCNFQGILGRQR